ncbi:MAG: hypothetical protein ACKO23_20780, partial [Gemmataceae bacterium]
RGVIAAYARLYGRLGIFEATYRGNVYVIDAPTTPGPVAVSSPHAGENCWPSSARNCGMN